MNEAGLLDVQLAEWWEAALIVGAASVFLTLFTVICWRKIVGKQKY